MAAPDPKNAFWRLWQQAGDIYGESTLRIGNRLVLPVWSFHTHGTPPVALWLALNTRMGPPWRPQTRKMRFGGSAGQQACDIYGESTLRIGNRLVLPV